MANPEAAPGRHAGHAVRAGPPAGFTVTGTYDECTPSHLAAIHQRIRGSQLRIIEDASHLCFAEQPAEFATTLNAFFDLTDRGSGL